MNRARTEQSPQSRRFGWGTWLILGLGVVILGGEISIFLRGRQPRVLASGAGKVMQLEASTGGLFWLERRDGTDPSGPNSALYRLVRPGKEPAAVLQGTNFLRFAVDGTTAFVLEGGPVGDFSRIPYPQGRLLQVEVSGGDPTVLASDLVNPSSLWVDEQSLVWTETYPTRAPGVNHVPALQYVTLIRTCPRAGTERGEVRQLAQIESSEPALQGRLLGVQDGFLYWLERRYVGREPGTSFVRRVALGGGEVETWGATPGRQTAAISSAGVYFTAHSVEAAPSTSYCLVYRITSAPPGKADRVELHPPEGLPKGLNCFLLTDWLPPLGTLLWRDSALYYGDWIRLWWVPLQWGPPRRLSDQLGGTQAWDLQGGFLFSALPGQEGVALLRKPIAWKAWIWNGLGG